MIMRHGHDRDRKTGALLVEMAIALSLIVVGVLGFFSTFQSMFSSVQVTAERDLVHRAFKDATGFLRSANFDTLYADSNGRSFPVSDLEDTSGNVATVDVTCFVDETTLPTYFQGLVQDIDGITGLTTTDCSTTYEVLPILLRLDYQSRYGPDSREVYMVLRE